MQQAPDEVLGTARESGASCQNETEDGATDEAQTPDHGDSSRPNIGLHAL